jgi:hypothetical protein
LIITIKEVDHITTLVVAAVHAFRIGYRNHFHTAKAESISASPLPFLYSLVKFITTHRSNIIIITANIKAGQRTINVEYPLAYVTCHVIDTETVGVERFYFGSIDRTVVQTTGHTGVITGTSFEVSHELTLPAAMLWYREDRCTLFDQG